MGDRRPWLLISRAKMVSTRDGQDTTFAENWEIQTVSSWILRMTSLAGLSADD